MATLVSTMAVQQGPERGSTEPGRLRAAVEAAVGEEMARGEIPGIAVVLVHEREVILSRGWGLADIDEERAVDPEETIFRFGSLSKLVTATAVMRLVEEGRLHLNAPAEGFLGRARLPGVGREPVRVHHLLTHTSGLDEHIFGQYSELDQPSQTLEEYLADRSLAGRWPPGEVISYSDHGYALLGLIVEQASGERFERYVERALFQPLDMVHASITPRLDPVHAGRLARGYHAGAGGLAARAEHVFNTYPSVALAATPTEMGRFLQLHLGSGVGPGGIRILEPGTVQAMHTRQASHHPAFDGRAYGFSFRHFGHHRALYHDGSTTGFTSRMVLVPESGFGFLLVYNHGFYGSGGRPTRAGRFKSRFTERVMDALSSTSGGIPAEATAAVEGDGSPELADRGFLATYREVPSHSMRTLEKINVLFGQRVLRQDQDGLVLDGRPATPLATDLFRTSDGALFALRRGTRGEYLLLSGNTAWVRATWWERADVQSAMGALFLIVFFGAAVWGAGASLRSGAGLRLMGPGVALVGALNLTTLIGVPLALYRANLHELFFGPPPVVAIMAGLPLLAAILSLGLGAVLLLRSSGVSPELPPLWIALVIFAGLAWLPWLHYWRLWSAWT